MFSSIISDSSQRSAEEMLGVCNLQQNSYDLGRYGMVRYGMVEALSKTNIVGNKYNLLLMWRQLRVNLVCTASQHVSAFPDSVWALIHKPIWPGEHTQKITISFNVIYLPVKLMTTPLCFASMNNWLVGVSAHLPQLEHHKGNMSLSGDCISLGVVQDCLLVTHESPPHE